MTEKLELKSCHEVIDTVDVVNIESVFHGKPTDPDILTVVMKDGKKIYCDEVCPIDSLQEEPVSEDLEEAADNCYFYNHAYARESFIEGAQWQKAKDESITEDLGEYINELSKQFPEVSFAKLSKIAVRVSRWQQNQDVKNKLPKITDRTELDEYAYQCAYNMSNDWAIDNPTWHDVEDACKLGANWQKAKDQSTIELAEDHAMLAGMEKMKEQMMAKAIDGTLLGGHLIKQEGITHPLHRGDKVKVIVIKED